MLRAIGDAAGLTIKAQVRRAAEHLGYEADLWRVREAFYLRAGSWSATALDDLRQRFKAWQAREAVAAAEQIPGGTMDASDHPTLAQRLGAIQMGLSDLTRQVDALAVELGRHS